VVTSNINNELKALAAHWKNVLFTKEIFRDSFSLIHLSYKTECRSIDPTRVFLGKAEIKVSKSTLYEKKQSIKFHIESFEPTTFDHKLSFSKLFLCLLN